MSGKLFLQIVILIVIGAVVLTLTKCAMRKCPIMGKYMKAYKTAVCPSCQK